MQSDPAFVISGQALLSVGAVLGALAGTISLLFKLLLGAKNEQLKDVIAERDFYKAALLKALESGERAASAADQATAIASDRARTRR